MRYSYLIMPLIFSFLSGTMMAKDVVSDNKKQPDEIRWDSKSLIINGRRVVPVMGEIHYSRIPEQEWETELVKMKDGGVNIIATYIFGTILRKSKVNSTGVVSGICANSLICAKSMTCRQLYASGHGAMEKPDWADCPTGCTQRGAKYALKIQCSWTLPHNGTATYLPRFRGCNGKMAVRS